MREGSEESFRRAVDLIPPRLHKRHAQIWPATVAAVQLTRPLPPTLAHGDVHLKNWYITGTGRMGLSDWQFVTRGHWSRGFGYTIATALTIEDRRACERDLLDFYLDHLNAAGGPKVSFDEGWIQYRRQLMTALTWWTITYNPAPRMPDMQPIDTALSSSRGSPPRWMISNHWTASANSDSSD
jgi:aminoglycoside phosphotransferase (APT) family kinase protein